ncbi:MAG: iron ABC transporter permease [Truepera sp.]|nr:iron ABC transporter permease [Truepera sp.]HRQ09852.1 iron ABC transporter permease [Trueperaceae bacterium]
MTVAAEPRRRRVRPRLAWVLSASVVALLAVMIVAVGLGSVSVGPAEVARAALKGLRGDSLQALDRVVWQLRFPRVVLAAVVGAALALAGTVFQGVFRNPLAEPYLIGTASGAGFGAVLVMSLGASVPLLARLGAPLVAFAFALVTVSLVLFLARQGGAVPTVRLILAGVVVGSLFTAGTSFLLVAAREQAAGILSWLLGGFGFSSWHRVGMMALFALPAMLLVGAFARALDLLQLGEEGAALLGLNVERMKLLLLGVATLVTAAAVSVAGVIGFVGLIVPHAARLALGRPHARLLPVAALWGAAFMVLADLLARMVIAPVEVPVGVVTSLVGGPFFLWLLRRRGGPA